jgi:peptide/nickel transport system substrate-binding protein
MRISKLLTVALGATFLTTFACALTSAEARSLKWARGADALTLDPHGQNEGPTIAFNNQVYETLIARDNAHKLVPGLAVSWRLVDPTTWEFKLRQGVKFHGGESFTADDVVFSYQRALAPTSDYKGYLASVKEIVKVDDHTV